MNADLYRTCVPYVIKKYIPHTRFMTEYWNGEFFTYIQSTQSPDSVTGNISDVGMYLYIRTYLYICTYIEQYFQSIEIVILAT